MQAGCVGAAGLPRRLQPAGRGVRGQSCLPVSQKSCLAAHRLVYRTKIAPRASNIDDVAIVQAPSKKNSTESIFGGRSCFLAALAVLGVVCLAPDAHASGLLTAPEIPGLVGDDPIREGFVSGLILILFSELGDKTFFIALLLALQAKKEAVFAGTFGALAVMTVISVGLGVALHEVDELLPATGYPLDDILSVTLLVWFGVQTLRGAEGFTANATEEFEEAGETLEEGSYASKEALALVLSTFTLVFAAEWGDKSFLATIALAAASSPVGVVAGAIAGHGIATALAVAGGNVMGKYVSEKAVAYIGGSLFLLFAAATTIDIVRELN